MKNFGLNKAFFWIMAIGFFAQLIVAQSIAASGDELEVALTAFIDAIKVGKTAVIVVAIVGLLRTNFVMKFISPFLQKIGFGWVLYQPEPKVSLEPKPEVILTGDTEGVNPAVLSTKLPAQQIKGPALPWVTLATGMAASVGSAIAGGQSPKQAILGGLISSGAAMGLFDLILKPIKKLF